MKIKKEEVVRLSKLSRLEFTDAEIESVGEHLDNIIETFKQLDYINTDDVPATAHILPFVNVLRDDVAGEPYPRDELLKNAPDTDGEAYIVPRVVE